MMKHLPHSLKNVARRMLGRPLVADPARCPLDSAVLAALGDGPATGAPPATDPELDSLCRAAQSASVACDSSELFSIDGEMLPCWRPEDRHLEDDWVTSADYYPLYHRFFKEAGRRFPGPRLLEIGVRTGYVGVCFAKAVTGPSFYCGVDPNLYLPDGLQRARRSFKTLGRHLPGFRHQCLLGYSDNPSIQGQLRRLGPFDLIHIDGDHTLTGKLVDLHLARSLLAPGGLVLVDDYTHIPGVIQDAVARALRCGWYRRFARLETKRGLALLQP